MRPGEGGEDTNSDGLAHAGSNEDIDDGDIGIVCGGCGLGGERLDGGSGRLHSDQSGVGWTIVNARRRLISV